MKSMQLMLDALSNQLDLSVITWLSPHLPGLAENTADSFLL